MDYAARWSMFEMTIPPSLAFTTPKYAGCHWMTSRSLWKPRFWFQIAFTSIFRGPQRAHQSVVHQL